MLSFLFAYCLSNARRVIKIIFGALNRMLVQKLAFYCLMLFMIRNLCDFACHENMICINTSTVFSFSNIAPGKVKFHHFQPFKQKRYFPMANRYLRSRSFSCTCTLTHTMHTCTHTHTHTCTHTIRTGSCVPFYTCNYISLFTL